MAIKTKILGFRIADDTKNIIIDIEYTMTDNSKVINPYIARYENFLGKTQNEILEWVERQIKHQSDIYLELEGLKENISNDLINKTLVNIIKTQNQRDNITYLLTNKGNLYKDYFDEKNYLADEIAIKKIDIDKDGNITETPI